MNEIVETDAFQFHNFVVLRGDEVWLTYDRPWWALIEKVRWWLTPGKESRLFLRVKNKSGRVSVTAKRISKTHIRIG